MSAIRFLSVGHCGADHGNISREFRRIFGVDVQPAETLDDALKALNEKSFALVLVNRVFDSDGQSGLDLIRRIKSDPALAQTPVMLVSNYADAQAEAVAAGAAPGFGKAELGTHEMLDRIRRFATSA